MGNNVRRQIMPKIIGLHRIYEQLLIAGQKDGKSKGGRPRKISDEQVIEMRRLRAADRETYTYRALSVQFGVSEDYVRNICRGQARVKGPDGSFTLI